MVYFDSFCNSLWNWIACFAFKTTGLVRVPQSATFGVHARKIWDTYYYQFKGMLNLLSHFKNFTKVTEMYKNLPNGCITKPKIVLHLKYPIFDVSSQTPRLLLGRCYPCWWMLREGKTARAWPSLG